MLFSVQIVVLWHPTRVSLRVSLHVSEKAWNTAMLSHRRVFNGNYV